MSVIRVVLALFLACAGLALAPTPAWASGTVTVTVSGHGSVTGDGIDCGPNSSGDCSQFYADVPTQGECDPDPKIPCPTIYEDPVIQLTAGADTNGYQFNGWSGCDSISGRTCTVTVDASRGVSVVYRDVASPNVGAPHDGGPVSGTITLDPSVSDNSGSVSRVEFYVRGIRVATATSRPFIVSFNTTSITDGSALLWATAYDAVGNSSTSPQRNLEIDNTAPQTSVLSGPADGSVINSRDVTFGLGSSDVQPRFSCRLYPSEATAPFFGICSGSTSHTVAGLADGTYVFEAQARDGHGNADATPAQRTFTVDTVAPDTTITKGPKSIVKTSTKRVRAVFEFGAGETAQLFECKLDAKPWTECSSPTSYRVAKGKHTFKVRATDLAGNRDRTADTWSWTVRRR